MSWTFDQVSAVLRHDGGRLFWLSGRRVGLEAGCRRKDGRVVVRLGGRGGPLVLRYHLIWLLAFGEWPTSEVDHINRDPSDDRPENLRLATSSQQKWNRGATKRSATGVKGVLAYGDRFTAQIAVGGRSRHLGVFDDLLSASNAYLSAAKSAAGEFACGS